MEALLIWYIIWTNSPFWVLLLIENVFFFRTFNSCILKFWLFYRCKFDGVSTAVLTATYVESLPGLGVAEITQPKLCENRANLLQACKISSFGRHNLLPSSSFSVVFRLESFQVWEV